MTLFIVASIWALIVAGLVLAAMWALKKAEAIEASYCVLERDYKQAVAAFASERERAEEAVSRRDIIIEDLRKASKECPEAAVIRIRKVLARMGAQ